MNPKPPGPTPADEQLLRSAAGGDERAFHTLVDRHAQRLYRLAVGLVGNAADAEDVLQEALVGAYKGLHGFEGRASVATWLTRILVTQAAKWRRDRKRRGREQAQSSEILDTKADRRGPGGAAGVDARIDLQTALRRLSEEHREILVLREFEQMAYEDIAEVLGIPRGTVESRLHRARRELAATLAEYKP
jgi:RNA polymerase sigma-70 factor (ECF subfamily)